MPHAVEGWQSDKETQALPAPFADNTAAELPFKNRAEQQKSADLVPKVRVDSSWDH
ncbi:hypothetical protein SY94_5288 (plasmid) [Agrobacterium tumefaciens]|nr:hypothetical protein SY94_5288 [Agrobacterium tumefaciens]